MSKHNKVNKDSYTQAGRLTPDDMARERQRQKTSAAGVRRERVTDAAARRARRSGGPESSRPRSAPEE